MGLISMILILSGVFVLAYALFSVIGV
jgi:hypothetical protein